MKQNIGNTIEGTNVPHPCDSFFLSLSTSFTEKPISGFKSHF